MLSKGISAPSGLQCSQDSISLSASRRVLLSTRTTFCSSGVGSKKSRLMTGSSPPIGSKIVSSETRHKSIDSFLETFFVVTSKEPAKITPHRYEYNSFGSNNRCPAIHSKFETRTATCGLWRERWRDKASNGVD